MTASVIPIHAERREWQLLVNAMLDRIAKAEDATEARTLWRTLRDAEADLTNLTTLAGAKVVELEGRHE